jgi:IS5 family transposase
MCVREGIETRTAPIVSQRRFASAEFALKKKRTRREKFLAEMERVVPWAKLISVIKPAYPTSGRVGRQPDQGK